MTSLNSDAPFSKQFTEMNDQHRPRKRKIDKDGFAIPRTPEISEPATGLGSLDLFGSENEAQEDQPVSETVSSYFQPSEEGQFCHQDDEYQLKGDYRECYQIEQNNVPNAEGDATQNHSNNVVQSFFKSFQDESTLLLDQWSQVLRKSEDYEVMCPQKLDMLIGEARSIEDNLNTKKDALCSRLKGIGKTLEM